MELSQVFDGFFEQIKNSEAKEDNFEFTKLFNERLLDDLQKDIQSYAKVLLYF